uniref:SWIM-type domain-containing protein n=1 Tax=Cacopsylla melanoneura TaxID=428564 RepID=A0A8D9BR71_9HEMI
MKIVLKHKVKSFMEYFHTFCLSETKKWAMFARRFPHKNVDTTMYVESFHNILKSIYLKRRPNKRVDTLLNLLLQVEEDNYSRRNLSLVTNNREAVINSITQQHVKSVSILDNNVEEVIGNSLWKVQSASNQTEGDNNNSCYDVQRCASVCPLPEWCFYKCKSPLCIGLCSHLYVCTCPTNSPLCKHIHKVHSQGIKKCGSIEPVSTSPEKPQSYSLTFPSYDVNNNAKDNDASKNNGNLLSTKKQQRKRQLLENCKALTELIENDKVPEICMSHVNGVLSQLLAECSSVGTSKTNITPTSLKPTMKRTSREKLACQVLPSKRKRKMKKTSYPTKAEKKQIQGRALENCEQNSDSEYDDLIIEEEVV